MTMTKMFVLILAAVSLMGSVSAFSVLPVNRFQVAPSSSCLRMSEPSDTASASDDNLSYDYDDALDVDNAPYESNAGETLVSNVMDLMPSSLGEASSEERTAINEALYKLEALNPPRCPRPRR